MNEHERHVHQQERAAERDSVILGIYKAAKRADPFLSAEQLVEQTATMAHCATSRVVSALYRRLKS